MSCSQGHVLKVTSNEVIVDFGYKSEGLVPIEQFRLPDGSVPVHPGDTIDVVIDRKGEEVEGYTLLSHEKAGRIRAWDTLEKAFRENLLVSGRILGRIKGGLAVDVGVEAFMPGSHADVRPVHNLDALIGHDIAVKIVKLNRRRGNVVVSHKLAVEEEHDSRKSAVLASVQEGTLVTGTVKSLTEYGAFVDLGGIDGLLHVSDISHGRIGHPSEVLHIGDEITVKVLKFDREKERISLGLKQAMPDPWEQALERYPVNQRVFGRVVSITDYGAFVELEPGVEGLIHVSEMTWSRRLKHPSKVVKAGDEVEAVVLGVQTKERRISLGIKQLEADPWTTVESRYSVGSVVEGRVRKLTDFGAFIEIEEGIDGLVPCIGPFLDQASEESRGSSEEGTDRTSRHPAHRRRHPASLAGDQATFARCLGDVLPLASSGGRRARAGLQSAPALGCSSNWRRGSKHCVIIPRSRAGANVAAMNLRLPIEAEFDFKIIRLNEAEKKIGLSMQAVAEDEERSRLEDYHRQAEAATLTIEEVINLKGQGEIRS